MHAAVDTVTPMALPPTADVTDVNSGARGGYHTSEHLANALRQAQERRYQDLLIVDVDAHHYETDAWREIIKYIEDPVLRYQAEQGALGADPSRTFTHSPPKRQGVSGRIVRYQHRRKEQGDPDTPRDVSVIRRTMHAIGIDYQVVFPTPMLELGLHPDPAIEVAVSWAYSRWFTEEVLPADPRIKTMIFLPTNDPDACLRAVEHFGSHPSVVGFMVASARRQRPIHDNSYMRLYRALEERGLPLGFHAVHDQKERLFEGMNRFISVHSLGFVFFNMVHATNWIFNGLPERFPDLATIWIESGLAWVPFLMQRLDNEFMMRSSEAPLLKRKPSEYMRDFYYSSQPMEMGNMAALELTMEMINADTQLLFASDYPHWDFNLPSTIYDLKFLSMQTKKRILGENAARLFGIDLPAGGAAAAAPA